MKGGRVKNLTYRCNMQSEKDKATNCECLSSTKKNPLCSLCPPERRQSGGVLGPLSGLFLQIILRSSARRKVHWQGKLYHSMP